MFFPHTAAKSNSKVCAAWLFVLETCMVHVHRMLCEVCLMKPRKENEAAEGHGLVMISPAILCFTFFWCYARFQFFTSKLCWCVIFREGGCLVVIVRGTSRPACFVTELFYFLAYVCTPYLQASWLSLCPDHICTIVTITDTELVKNVPPTAGTGKHWWDMCQTC